MKVLGNAGVLLLGVAIISVTYGQTSDTESEEERRVRRLGDSLAVTPDEEWVPAFSVDEANSQLTERVRAAADAMAQGNLISPPENNATFYLLEARNLDASNPDVVDGLNQLAQRLVQEAQAQATTGSGEELVAALESIDPGNAAIGTIRQEIARQQALASNLEAAAGLQSSGALYEPAGANALDAYQAVLSDFPDNATALEAVSTIAQTMLDDAVSQAESGDFASAQRLIDQAEGVLGTPVDDVREQISRLANGQTLQAAQQALDRGDLASAAALIDEMRSGDVPGDLLDPLTQQLEEAQWLADHPPGSTFVDSAPGIPTPTMVVIPDGTFTMGSPPTEANRKDEEGPLTSITIGDSFALSRTEITNTQFAAFVDATGYLTDAEKGEETSVYDAESGRMSRQAGVNWRRNYRGDRNEPDHPVIHVSWNDAQAYAAWLADITGEAYRLPSEAEFEYSLRAGTTGIYWWGSGTPEDPLENLAGARDESPTGLNWEGGFNRYRDGYWGTAPAGSLAPNAFGLMDMGGNVMEWVQDCTGDALNDKPRDGSPLLTGTCTLRIVKGGSWASLPARSRSAQRLRVSVAQPNAIIGFRVARDL